jgi:hypothetical protein
VSMAANGCATFVWYVDIMSVCGYSCICAQPCIHARTRIHIHMCIDSSCSRFASFAARLMQYIHSNLHTCMHAYIYLRKHTKTYIHTYTYTQRHTYTHIHTYIHIHIQTCMLSHTHHTQQLQYLPPRLPPLTFASLSRCMICRQASSLAPVCVRTCAFSSFFLTIHTS